MQPGSFKQGFRKEHEALFPLDDAAWQRIFDA